MIINSTASKPTNIDLSDNLIEAVDTFKLLGVTIDDKLAFDNHVSNLKSTVCRKLFAIKNIFFLSFDTKLQFSKLFCYHTLTIAHNFSFFTLKHLLTNYTIYKTSVFSCY
jgi:hypothetical protein